jgi:hypothetical protein
MLEETNNNIRIHEKAASEIYASNLNDASKNAIDNYNYGNL